MVIRIALYSHDSVGLGHVRRNLALAHALTATLPDLVGEEVTGILISSQPSATGFDVPAGWDWMIVPSVTPRETGYAPRHLSTDLERLTALRGGAVRAAVKAFRPDLFVVDRHPFGVARELDPALRWLRRRRPSCATVLGLRDVLDDPDTMRAEWAAVGGAAAIRAAYDAIWVYGDPRVHDVSATGEIPPGLRALVQHTGYLSHGRRGHGHDVTDPPFVLTTVGGGSDGFTLASAAARATLPEGVRHVVVTGPEMPAAHRREIRATAAAGTKVVRSVPDALALARRAEAVVGMGGYNTVCELMSTSTPALIVPRVQRRSEQRLRADALAALGAIEVLPGHAPSPEALSAWFADAIGRRTRRAGIDLDGLGGIGRLAADALVRRLSTSHTEELPHAV